MAQPPGSRDHATQPLETPRPRRAQATGGEPARHVGAVPVPELPAHPAHVQHQRGREAEGDVRAHGHPRPWPAVLEHHLQEVRHRPQQARRRAHDRRGEQDRGRGQQPAAVQDPSVDAQSSERRQGRQDLAEVRELPRPGALREDLERMKRVRLHRGIRHYWGIRVRGQHTKTTGRHRAMGDGGKK
ncbi:unnamed protein product [Prorocentrum cordatum]|uniref:40S ribosomal protein S18 n=1 Tax=Prorocentrum cordatum TaxID=2364126 RepID=A0ABN9Q200_9DINO|nr:unnamed protein product [Polarella glacialis]